ncbi:MAG TPA: hypothetical protein VKR22_00700, partial [Acidimicrobiales bacterium]|nr:hypothetical protein [Acidimicrobiales bacterium]
IVLGLDGVAGHLFQGLPGARMGYFAWDRVVRPYSAVTGACLMTRRSVFADLGGFDEALQTSLNDVDYCLRLIETGRLVLYTPHAELVHHGSVSRGVSLSRGDARHFVTKWGLDRLRDDPYYSPNLSRFAPWCPVRGEDEDERWRALVEEVGDGAMAMEAG